MDVVRTLLIVIEAVISLLLIGVILLQRSKSEGLGLAFGAGMGETLFGSRAGNVLTRATVILAILFLVNTLALANLFSRREASLVERSLSGTEAPRAAEEPWEQTRDSEPAADREGSVPASPSEPDS